MHRVKIFETNEEDWDIINDDGFVYKRKKRRIRIRPTVTTSVAHPPPGPAIEEENRRQRKKKAVIKLKEKYHREVSQWEILSNTLKTMHLKAQTLQETPQDHAPPTSCDDHHSFDSATEPLCGEMLDELMCQVEAQKRVIQDVSSLSDVANALFKAEEEKTKRSLIELPIWDYSPQQLMASLCQD